MRDWVFKQIRKSLKPIPKPAGSPLAQLNRGRQQGLMMGRIDMAFRQGTLEALSVSTVLAWCHAHPKDVLDVMQWCAQQAYGRQFRQWWNTWIAPNLGRESGRTPVASR